MKILKILSLILIYVSPSLSQDCPSGISSWTTVDSDYGPDQYGNSGTVSYDYNVSGSKISIKMDWDTMYNNSDFIPNSAMKKILEHHAVKSRIPQIQDTLTGTISVFFETECTSLVRTILEVKETADSCCADGMDLDDEISEWNNSGTIVRYINVRRPISCGTGCCERRYNISRVYDSFSSAYISVVGNYTTFTYCEESNETNCLTGEPEPCEGDCDQW
jgi:hypothetical protein